MPPAFPPTVLAGFVSCLLVLVFSLLVRGLRRRVTAAKWSDCGQGELPPEVAREMSPWLARLAHFGFRPVENLRSLNESHAEGFRWLLANADQQSFATLDRVTALGGGHPRTELTFFTAEAGGTLHVTADRLGIVYYPIYWSLVQSKFRRVEDQWRAHLAVLPEVGRMLPDPARLATMLAADEEFRYQALLRTQDYAEVAGPALKPKWRILPQQLGQALASFFRGGKYSPFHRKDLSAPPTRFEEPEIPVSVEEAVERDLKRYRNLSHTRKPGDFIRRWLMAATTVMIFTLVFGRDQPGTIALLTVGLLVLHEFGHWLAMRIFGFRGLWPVYIPFSGDIDRARKLHAPAWQHLVVLLAGPLPGLLFGWTVLARALLEHNVPPWLLDFGGLAVVLNGLHLLPFLPLDGGKIADLLFFRDVPWLRPVFTVVSGFAALTGALTLKSRPMRQIAFSLFGGLIWDLRTIAVVRGARKVAWAGELTDENEVLRRAFRSVREEGNSGFVGSYGWHFKVDAMLAEVLRRRPGAGARLLGGGFYLCAFLLPAVAIGLLLALPLAPRNFHPQQPDFAREFQATFPVESQAAVNPSAVSELAHQTTVALENLGGDRDSRWVSTRLLPVIGEPLDKMDWADAGLMLRRGELESGTMAAWFELLASQMETACATGGDEEAMRRAEVILHAVSKMEPAPSMDARRSLQAAEERALTVIEQESATGKFDAKRLRAVRDRINLLYKEATPEVDDYLLVREWGDQKREEEAIKSSGIRRFDVHFWRDLPGRTAELRDYFGASSHPLTPAPVAVARLWKQTRRVGELPPTLDTTVSVTHSEASLIYDFCERQRELTWRRIAALSALNLECARKQSGKFPQTYRYNVSGGASLQLVREGGPWLRLVDLRDPGERQPPVWLIPEHEPDLEPSKALDHQSPLFGAPRVLDISMQ